MTVLLAELCIYLSNHNHKSTGAADTTHFKNNLKCRKYVLIKNGGDEVEQDSWLIFTIASELF